MKRDDSNGAASTNPQNPVNPVQKGLPNSRKVYVAGELHPDIRIPFREISLAPTKTMSGEIEVNEPVRVYDTSGPWGDFSIPWRVDVTEGSAAHCAQHGSATAAMSSEETAGRPSTPIDDGYLSEGHAASRAKLDASQRSNSNVQRLRAKFKREQGSGENYPVFSKSITSAIERKPLRARNG